MNSFIPWVGGKSKLLWIQDAAQTLENTSPHITEWDESALRQLVETVKVLSKDEIAITLKGGIEICQKIMY